MNTYGEAVGIGQESAGGSSSWSNWRKKSPIVSTNNASKQTLESEAPIAGPTELTKVSNERVDSVDVRTSDKGSSEDHDGHGFHAM